MPRRALRSSRAAEPDVTRSSREQSRDGLSAARPSLDCSRDERVTSALPVAAERPVSSWANEELAALAARGLSRHLEPLSTPQGPVVEINGEEQLINFSSNDYLGLANDPEQKAAAI